MDWNSAGRIASTLYAEEPGNSHNMVGISSADMQHLRQVTPNAMRGCPRRFDLWGKGLRWIAHLVMSVFRGVSRLLPISYGNGGLQNTAEIPAFLFG